MTVSRPKGAKGKADALFSKIIRSRGHCERCRGTRTLQCAHIVGRTYNATRTDLDNAWSLCAACHRLVDYHWDEKRDLVQATIGFRKYHALKRKAQAQAEAAVQFDWDAELARLQAIAKTRRIK